VSQGVTPRSDVKINDGWKFKASDTSGAEQTSFDDASWQSVQLPHTWNEADGQDGPSSPYYRGIGWYRRHYTPPNDFAGRKIYLQFDGSNIITDAYVNGSSVGTHRGGFARFRFDVTDKLQVGKDNVIAVKVDNAAGVDANNTLITSSPTVHVPPLSGDFTMYGGLYRDVHLLATDLLAISPTDNGASGVYVKQTNVSAASADLAITVKLSNANAADKNATVTAKILDANGGEVQTLNADKSVPAGGNADAVLSGKLTNPHLWNGLSDPYLYRVRVELRDGDRMVDSVTEPLGVRSLRLDANQGFFLNEKYLDLYGVNKHQDHKDRGWAISEADTEADFAIIKELGATMVRLAHYQHAQHTYDLTDRVGYIVWAEIPVVNRIHTSPEFAANAEQQLVELIRQNYNHPSIAFFSVGNEVLLRAGPNPNALIQRLSEVCAAEDSTRFVSYAANAGDQNNPVNWHGAAHGFNEYQGWYFARVPDFAIWADGIHRDHASAPIGVTEYGAGANVTQHNANPAGGDTGGDHTSGGHSEEYQAYYHEGYWAAMKTRPFLFAKLVWNGFDFASDGRSEGGLPGLNDKGLVTFDRQIKKDAFYFYKANWSKEPFVYITSRRFTNLAASSTSIKVYSNADSVDLKLNGTSLGKKTSPDHVFVWTNVSWASGNNVVEASAGSATDTVTWTR
jgi:beta-galactosidase